MVGADLVLGITAAADATAALTQALDAIPQGAVYADLATASRRAQAEAGRAIAAGAGLGFADVALMSPVPGTRPAHAGAGLGPGRAGHSSPPWRRSACRSSTPATSRAWRPPASCCAASSSRAWRRWSIESMRAAEAAGLAAETWDNIVGQLTAADEALVRRLVTGTGRHAGAPASTRWRRPPSCWPSWASSRSMTNATAAHLRRVGGRPAAVPSLPG